MAHIHGTSGSTKYLLNGVRPVNGKKPATLKELHHLHNHHEQILAEVEISVGRKQDEIILGFSNEETRLDRIVKEGIANRTKEVDREIGEIDNNIANASNFFMRTYFQIHHWIGVSFRDHKIHSPYAGKIRELHNIQYTKQKHISNKPLIIRSERENVTRSYNFLKNNQTFLAGADGEEFVIETLYGLPNEYHVLNDVNLHFQKAIHWRERHEYIKNCQIDHVVVGPTGIFLLETKNWKASDIDLNSDKLRYQVRRSSMALWYYLKKYYRRSEWPTIRNVIVSLKGSTSGRKPDKYIDIVVPNQLCRYITARKNALTEPEIYKFVDLIKNTNRLRP